VGIGPSFLSNNDQHLLFCKGLQPGKQHLTQLLRNLFCCVVLIHLFSLLEANKVSIGPSFLSDNNQHLLLQKFQAGKQHLRQLLKKLFSCIVLFLIHLFLLTCFWTFFFVQQQPVPPFAKVCQLETLLGFECRVGFHAYVFLVLQLSKGNKVM
jgi:hypothetical protein